MFRARKRARGAGRVRPPSDDEGDEGSSIAVASGAGKRARPSAAVSASTASGDSTAGRKPTAESSRDATPAVALDEQASRTLEIDAVPVSSGASARQAGPARVAAHIRSTITIDYQPDVCKDYKDTGYCAYGNNCKFLHDRTDYRSTKQIQGEWAVQQRTRKRPDASPAVPDHQADVPFACHVCRNRFTEPVVTPCKHYVCEACLLQHFASAPTSTQPCPVCGKETGGVFNPAARELAQRRRRREEEEAKEQV